MTQQQTPQPASPSSYSDVFDLTLSPYGASFRFGATGPVDQKTGAQVVELNSRVFMSLEHLKALAFVVVRELIKHEKKMGVTIPLPDATISQLLYPPPPNIPPAALESYINSVQPLALKEWAAFWHGKKDSAQAVNPNGTKEGLTPVPLTG